MTDTAEVGVLTPEEMEDDMSRALTVARGREMVAGLLRPVANPEEVLAAQEATRDLVNRALKRDRDYGVIPGTGSKPTLLKPGAERINAAFGCVPRYHVIDSEIDHDREVEWSKRSGTAGTSFGLYRYVIACELVHRESGVVVGHGIGSCSTMESQYITVPRDSENTVLKMAEKRALIAATLNAFGLSDQFTQDVEDAPELYQRTSTPASTSHVETDEDTPYIDRLVAFGKHRGHTWRWVADTHPDYIDWLRENKPDLVPAQLDFEISRHLDRN